MLAKQRDLLKLHKPPQSKDKLKDQDLKVSMAAGSLFGDKANLMSARCVISAVQCSQLILTYCTIEVMIVYMKTKAICTKKHFYCLVLWLNLHFLVTWVAH
jgi:hypothetical protein